MVAYFDESAVEITNGNLKPYEYRSDESSRWLKLEFCTNCGTTVTATAEFAPRGRAIFIGTFDDPNWIRPQAHFFTRSALHWIDLPVNVELFETIPNQTR